MSKYKCETCQNQKFNIIMNPTEITLICVQCGHQEFIKQSETIQGVEKSE